MIAQTLADRLVWLGYAAVMGMVLTIVAGAAVVWAMDPKSPLHPILDALGACDRHPGDESCNRGERA